VCRLDAQSRVHVMGCSYGQARKTCSPEEIEQLKYLSGKCGGWIIWDEQAKGEKFVPMEDWLRLYEGQRMKASE
jgi:hypothetical protein